LKLRTFVDPSLIITMYGGDIRFFGMQTLQKPSVWSVVVLETYILIVLLDFKCWKFSMAELEIAFTR